METNPDRTDADGLYQRHDSPFWWASYIDASSKRTRRSTGTADRRQAEATLIQWRQETYQAQHQPDEPSGYTFDELMLSYLQATELDKRAPWRDRSALKHLYPVFTGRELVSITPFEVKAYVRKRRQEAAAPSTINKEVGLLSAAVNFARDEWGWNIPNPAARKRLKEPESRVRSLTEVEAAALLQAAAADPRAQHLPDLIRLALHTGMRRGELLGLEWRRVDLQRDLIRLEPEHTKAGKRRSIPMNKEAQAAILSRLRWRDQRCSRSPWVFANSDGSRIGDVKNSFTSACRRAGINDFRFHDLRHTCASWLVSAGVPLAEVRDVLGHSTIKMTERYAHLAPENIRQALTKLDHASHV